MPSKSAAQARLMAAVAHSPSFAKKVGISQSVGKEFNQADKGHKFKEGGDTMAKKPFPFEKSKKDVEPKGMKEGSKKEEALDKKQAAFAKGGFVSRADGVAQRGKTQAKQIAMCGGGKVKK